jgi:hypothetical protein
VSAIFSPEFQVTVESGMNTRNQDLFMHISTAWVFCIIIVSTNKLWAGNEKFTGQFEIYQSRCINQKVKNKKKGKKVMEVQRQIFTGVCRITET